MPFQVGPFQVVPHELPVRAPEGKTTNRVACEGRLYSFEARTRRGATIEIHYAHWENGERDVRPHFAEGGGVPFSRLNCGRLRLDVQSIPEKAHAHRGRSYAVLRGVDVPPGPEVRPKLASVAVKELSDLAGCNVEIEFARLGARACGIREDVYGETHKYRSWPCVVFDANDPRPPVAAFLLTRALPLLRSR
ncbi:MAG: hypothetical protein ABJF88_11245 [Rhodothermales bacterium]